MQAKSAHQQAAAEAAAQLDKMQSALTHLEEDACDKLGQADAAVAEAEAQLEEVMSELQEARDAVKVQEL